MYNFIFDWNEIEWKKREEILENKNFEFLFLFFFFFYLTGMRFPHNDVLAFIDQ